MRIGTMPYHAQMLHVWCAANMPLRLGSSQAYATNGASEIISSIYTAACGTLWGLAEVHSTIAVTAPRSQHHFATMDGLILEGKDDGKSNKARWVLP